MRLRSSITRDGLDRTPHRAFMRAMGLDDAAIAQADDRRGVDEGRDHALQHDAWSRRSKPPRQGVEAAGGTPREFTTISVSDGIGMNHEGMKFSLVSREVIANSIEAVVQGHAYDGLVGFRRLRQDACPAR